MTRQRLYNPAQLTPEELKASFVARKDTLAELLRLIREQTPGRPCQHMMLVGPRGMGKTTLGLRLLHEILETPELAANWQPVAFHEESYGIGDLADFWLAALRHLTRATDDPQWEDRAKALQKDEKDTDRQAAYALASLMDFCQTSGKRLLLFVENLDTVLEQLSDERQIHALRASLIERTDILLIGSANTVFEAIRSHGEPLYEFFRLFILKGLGPEETRRILTALADGEGKPEVMDALDREQGRLETIRRLTGGNPRLVVLACRILIESPLGSAFEDLERLIDEQTPYFKARIEELPVQARKVFHCLAGGWKPMQSKEVAESTKLSSSHASAQLRQLMEKGYAREVHLPNAKRTLYEVGDRFYNIYYLLRFSRTGRDRLERLMAFLHDLFGAPAFRTMYGATLVELRGKGLRGGETSHILSALASYVAKDGGFKGREDWFREALTLANDMFGPDAPVIGEIHEAFANYGPSGAGRVAELIRRGNRLLKAGHLADAEAIYRELVEESPNDTRIWFSLGLVLTQQERYEEALDAYEQALHHLPTDTAASRLVSAGVLAGKALALHELNRLEDAIETLEKVAEYVHLDDSPLLRHGVAAALTFQGDTLSKLGRHEEALSAKERVVDYVRLNDPPDLRRTAVRALVGKFRALIPMNRDEECSAAFWLKVSEYVRTDDPPDMRRSAATALAIGGEWSNILGRWRDAEVTSRKATTIDPTHDESWRVLAEAILGQNDDTRLAEAVDFARRAVELAPHSSIASHTLSDILVRRGDWTEALSALERALRLGTEDLQDQQRPALTESLIRAAAAGHGTQVKRMMEKFGLTESMEPLWHAVRAELGEELEPLPAEIMDAVADLRREFARMPDAPSDAT